MCPGMTNPVFLSAILKLYMNSAGCTFSLLGGQYHNERQILVSEVCVPCDGSSFKIWFGMVVVAVPVF